ncbi:hypothetical protein ACSNOH_00810 [Streptomyces sp. URMC 127]|uniref:hypothetical protein n=1 Tax=Streptomyces sp. URMC 127 TaxID=3423402 RepID=UPI003F1BCA79
MSSVLGSCPARAALWCAGGLLVVGVNIGMVVVGLRLWNGEPYPAADPDRVATRLKEETRRVYDEAALPKAPDAPARVATNACYYRGLKSIAHIDRSLRDVHGFELSWQVTDIPEAVARSAQERTRLRLAGSGWELTSENISDRGFRFEQRETGDKVDVNWYRSTGTFAVSIYAPCGKVSEGFDEYNWPGARWTPA